MDQKDEVKLKSDIVTIIGEKVELKKAGRNFKGICPFHNEKTSSFIVSPELQIYKCFGCGKSGDVFTFLEEYEGMDFSESLKYLAERAGIKLKTFKAEKGVKDYLFEINSNALKFYNFILTKHPTGKIALNYLLKERGISEKSIEEFGLGFSPNDSSLINRFLVGKKKFNISLIEKAGIGYKRGNFFVDRFRGRVIFPLFDHRGNVLGFAGRVLPGVSADMAKYINSPETEIYHKSNVLYGLNISREFIKRKKLAIIVEGELDLISSWQIGIKNVVAIKGSALTEEQVRLVSRFADKVILALDSDFAGNEAAKRGIKVAQEENLEIKVAILTTSKDPDEAARKDPDGYKKALIHSVSIWDFLVDAVFKKYSLDQSQNISKEVVPILASIEDKIVQAQYIGKVARRLGIPEEAVDEQVNKSKANVTNNSSNVTIKVENKGQNGRNLIEDRLVILALKTKPTILLNEKLSELITTPFAKKILSEYLNFNKIKENFTLSEFANSLPEEVSGRFAEMVLIEYEDETSSDAVEKEMAEIQKALELKSIKDRLSILEKEMRDYSSSGDISKMEKAQQDFDKLIKTRSALEDGEK